MEALAALPPELVALVIPLLLAYLRVQAAVLVFPVLSERVLSVRVRTAIAMMLAPVALSVSGSTAWSQNIGLPDFAVLALRELLIGFLIAGVPGALVLGIVTFLLSLIPMGPPLVWIPATAWLAWKGDYTYAVFLGVWGTFVISGVDNVLKPYLISRGGNLPLVIVLLGVFGGLIAFGFIGLFIGPTLLAVAYSLLTDWSASQAQVRREDKPCN